MQKGKREEQLEWGGPGLGKSDQEWNLKKTLKIVIFL